jgi:DNA (cytosine-5)-methyltransferase 1
MNLLSLFSGIGAFEKALDNIGVEYDLVNYCEIDKFASKAYSLIHGVNEDKNLKDVTKIDTSRLNDIDLITYGFPCQDISLAGLGKGFEDEEGNRTRSGLFFEALRIIEDTKPKVAIAENVKALVSKKFNNEFNIVLESLEKAGYNNYYQVMNAEDYGIPQHRERVFIVSIRKDIDTYEFRFPKPIESYIRLKDVLESDVDESYNLSDTLQDRFTITDRTFTKNVIGTTKAETTKIGQRDAVYNPNGIMGTLTATDYKQPKQVATLFDFLEDDVDEKYYLSDKMMNYITSNDSKYITSNTKSIVNKTIASTITTREGNTRCDTSNYICSDLPADANIKFLKIKNATNKGYMEAENGDYVNLSYPDSKTRRGRVGKQVSQTLLCSDANGVVENMRIRKLTPKECFRLMGFDDKDVDVLVENKISNTQLYKMAGNSIVVNVLEHLFSELRKARII